MNVIESERLALRLLDVSDAAFILELVNQDAFIRHIGDKGVRDLAGAGAYILQGPMASYRRFGFGLYLTALRGSGMPIGICGLVKRDGLEDADIGFAFLARHESKGYATEAAAAVLEYGLRVRGLERVVAITTPDNGASIAVLKKIGLQFARMIRLAGHDRELKLFSTGGRELAADDASAALRVR